VETTLDPAATVVVAAWVAVATAAVVAAADLVVAAVVVAAAAAGAVVAAGAAVVVVAAGDKRTIDGENNYEINIRKNDFVENIRGRGSDHRDRFSGVGPHRGAGQERDGA
jgi:hypothetical protein